MKDLPEILKLHQLWLDGDLAGCRANLEGADLTGADLSGANLEGANLTKANLEGATMPEGWDQ